MKCTHPVLYSRNGELFCKVCGEVLPVETLAKPEPGPIKAEPVPAKKKKR